MTEDKAGGRSASLRRATARPGLVAISAATIAFALYLATMCRTYGPIDKGELAAVARTLGIAHPTGYPTLTLLGHLVTRISPLRPVLSLNILAALLTAAGVGLMALVFGELLRLAGRPGWPTERAETRKEGRKAGRKKEAAKPAGKALAESGSLLAADRVWLAGLAALFAGFTTTWWSQATGFEVYALHAFLLPLVTLLFLKFLERRSTTSGVAHTWPGMAFAFVLGLAFTNHMSTIMLAPAFLVLYFRVTAWSIVALQDIVRLIPAFLLGLLPYIYLPLRASVAPRLNWGNPSTWESFWAHVGGEQFHFAMFYAPRVFGQQTAYLLNTLVSDTAYVGLVIAGAGILYLVRRNGVLAAWIVLLFLTCLGVSGLYDINDIGNYHLAGIFAVGAACAFGLAALRQWFGFRITVAVGLLMPALNGAFHYRAMDESGNFLVEDLARNVLGSLPENAVIISNDWDYWTSGAIYAQEVEGFRKDVVVLDPESLRAEWYLDQLAKHRVDLMASAMTEVDAFRGQIREFQRAKGRFGPTEAAAYFQAYYAMIDALIERNADRRAFFVTEHVETRIAQGWQRVPLGLAYRLTKETAYQEQPSPRYAFRPWTGRVDPYVVKICELYTMGLLARARYEEHGNPAKAKEYGLYAISFDPQFSENEVPDFPLHIDAQIQEVLRNYRQLRERAQRLAE